MEETLDQAAGFVAAGWRHVRLQVGQPGLGTYGAPGIPGGYPDRPHPDGWDVQHYLRTTPLLFARAREVLGDDVELLHDVHSRLTPKQAVMLARSLEPYRLFFLEDVIAPEHYDRLPEVRAASPVPIAVGELVSSVTDAVRLVRDLGVDLLRLHISAVGGLTPARKLTALCELLGVQTAWHAPGDVSPVGRGGQHRPGRVESRVRHPGGLPLLGAGDGGLPGYAGAGGRVCHAVPGAGLGGRPRRGAGGEVPAPPVPARAVGGPGARPGRRARAALSACKGTLLSPGKV